MVKRSETRFVREKPRMGVNISDARTTEKSVSNMLLTAILETVEETGDAGAPSGVIYAAMMHVGVTLDTYNGMITILKNCEFITEKHHILHTTAKGRAAVKKKPISFEPTVSGG